VDPGSRKRRARGVANVEFVEVGGCRWSTRIAFNRGLAECQRIHKAGEKPSTPVIKSRRNAYRKAELPWSCDDIKCAGGQAIMHLGAGFADFLRDRKKPRNQRKFRCPRFKGKALNEWKRGGRLIQNPAVASPREMPSIRIGPHHPRDREALLVLHARAVLILSDLIQVNAGGLPFE
jgi:hypothetical protein